ncbi:UDP-N-acetylmuramoyl-tripeptide--D-alanyl-D-alanine ligase [Patescibacteria group bacterium]|nr:UDP-N-acetylmuramoyl-tripeptide--D-alanyl-D-alanine ligase [Patescibacteria group bacterium]
METQDIIFIFIVTIFILLSAKHILYWVWLWQLKEYRADRMRAHFQDIGFKNSLLALIGYSSLRQNKMPKFTIKSLLIFFCAFMAGVLLPIILLGNLVSVWKLSFQVSGFYFLILTLPLVIFLLVIVLNFISNIFKRRIIERARKKIAKFPNLTVVGITGSYGKSATKEILASILEKKYKILKTPANINTAIGIAQLILRDLTAEHQIFIAEIGAYKKGEIKEICDIVKPKIGILTAVNEQHLALFGNIENTIAAKFELIELLPKDGLAILNIGDKNIQKGLEARKISAQKKLYSAEAKADISAVDIDVLSGHPKFRTVDGAQIQDFKINLIGRHNVSNALAAIAAAEYFGLGVKEISEILRRINHFPHTFFSCAGPNGSIFINDTYNANPDGVTAGIDYLKDRPGRKIIVMSSLIELGDAARKVHKRLGKEISKIAQKLILTDDYYMDEIKAGARENSGSALDIKIGNSAKIIAEYLKQNLRSTDTVLFINRGAGKVLELLKK